jgi:hypothetical protein
MAEVEEITIPIGMDIDKVLKSAEKLRKTLDYALKSTEGKDLTARLESIRIKADASAKSIDDIQKSLKGMESVKMESSFVKELREDIEQLKVSLDEAQKDLEKTKIDVGAGLYDTPLRNKGFSEEQIVAETNKLLEQKQAIVERINNELATQQQLLESTLKSDKGYADPKESPEYQAKVQELEKAVNQAKVITASWDEAMSKSGGEAVRPLINYMEELQVQSDALSSKINEITNDFKSLEEEKNQLMSEGATLTPEYQAMDDALQSMCVRAKALEDTMDNLIAEGNIGTTAYESAEGEYNQLVAEMEELGNKMMQIKEEGKDAEIVDPSVVSRLSEINSEEDRLTQETMQLYEQWRRVQQAIADANNIMAQGHVPQGASPTAEGDTSAIWNSIGKGTEVLDDIPVSAKEADAAIRSLMQTFRGFARFIPGVSARGVMAISLLNRGMDALSNMSGKVLVAAIKKLGTTILKFTAQLLSNPIFTVIAVALVAVIALFKKIKKVVEDTKKELAELGKIGVKALTALAKGFLELGKLSVKAFVGLGTGVFKSIANGITSVINKLLSLKSVILENLKLMAKWNNGVNAVNTAMSNLTSSLAYLKAALATAFAPILTTIEPMLTRLIDKLAEVITMIGMFIAKITGATSFQKAIRVQKDYTKALEGTGSAAKKALGPLDNLNVITSQSGGGGEAVDFGLVDLEDVEFPDFLEKMAEFGRELGTKIRDFLNGIDWDRIKEGAEYAAKAIANFVNAFFGVAGLGKAVGKALGEAINTLTLFANDLLTLIDWGQIGKQFGEMVQKLIDTINWDEVGQVFSNALNSLMELAYNFFANWDGATLGQGLTELFQNAVGRIDWVLVRGTLAEGIEDLTGFLNEIFTPDNFKLIGDTLSEMLNTIFFSIGEFVKNADWEQWGQSLAAGINQMFKKFNASAAGTNISNLAKGLLDMIENAITHVNWDEVSKKLIEFLTNIDWAALANKAVELSTQLRGILMEVWKNLKDSGAIDEIMEAVADILADVNMWKKAFKKIKNDMFWTLLKEKFFNWSERCGEALLNGFRDAWDTVANRFVSFFEQAGMDTVAGIGNGIAAALDLLIAPIELIVLGIIDTFKELFGIHSPAKNTEFIGENIVLGILEGFGLVDFLQAVTTWWTTNVTPWFNSIQENIDILTEAISLKVDAIKNKLIDSFRAIKNGIKIPINGIIAMVEGLVNKIIDGVNWLVDKLNSLPDLEITNPFTGAEYSLGINLPKLTPIQIPRLAQGAVLPPNSPFLAMLGDQKNGTNVEAPLDTIKQALAEVMAEMGGSDSQEIVINIDGREVMKAMVKQNNEYKKQHNGASALA